MMAAFFKDLKKKQFIASSSTDLNGEPRVNQTPWEHCETKSS